MAHAYRNHVDERGLARVLQADERELHLLLEEKAAFAHAGWRLRREARVLRCAAARTCECTRGPNRPSSGTTLQSFASPLLSPIRISAREDRHQALASQASSCVPTTAAHVPITSTVTPTVTHCCYARRYAHRCIHCYVHRHAHRYIQRYAHRYTPLLSWRGGRTGRASDGFSRSARKGVRGRPDLKLTPPSALALALALALGGDGFYCSARRGVRGRPDPPYAPGPAPGPPARLWPCPGSGSGSPLAPARRSVNGAAFQRRWVRSAGRPGTPHVDSPYKPPPPGAAGLLPPATTL